jgi:uncharacterized damage-inducible protein DinB
MTTIPPQNYSKQWEGDDRPALPSTGSETEVLAAYLEWHRATVALKCSGLSAEQLSARSIPPSSMSLHGLIRHLTAAERWWLRIQFAAEDIPMLYYSDDDPDQDFDDLSGDPFAALAAWRDECDRTRAIVAANPDLDRTGIRRRDGQPISLRVILVKMIAEYAQHNGHADLLRECIDGATGQ